MFICINANPSGLPAYCIAIIMFSGLPGQDDVDVKPERLALI